MSDRAPTAADVLDEVLGLTHDATAVLRQAVNSPRGQGGGHAIAQFVFDRATALIVQLAALRREPPPPSAGV